MNFYVDFDDCLCETAKAFTMIAGRLFGKNVPYEDVRFFDLQKSFSLSDEEYIQLMEEGHRPEVLLSYEETPGACDTIRDWLCKGHEVNVITGRPYSAYDASRKWLDEHGLSGVKLFCLNKYGRDSFYQAGEHNLELEDFYRMHFDIAVEDSPMALPYLEHFPGVKVMVVDRPWNRGCDFPSSNYIRCMDWDVIRECVRYI
ncbi:5' nucleotidase, NT5C type [Butyrivibrio sp. MC2013]|uniref:5' nucleotidase, NT5C type n=1 Tax=Butyrivibrio sp. MC2013 TaxID=1280686 RepID=UPI0003FFF243|nr:2-dehydropantoate 2-reductase [Butyrivibrio sp. MC2013]